MAYLQAQKGGLFRWEAWRMGWDGLLTDATVDNAVELTQVDLTRLDLTDAKASAAAK